MKIAIIGYGFVGSALFRGFIDKVQVIKVDPKLNTDLNDLKNFNPDAIFICVPTPMRGDGKQDLSILQSVINELQVLQLDSLIVLKSTILPDFIKDIQNLIPNFVYNPEFLREKHADEDFIHSKLIIFGGSKGSAEVLADIYKNYTKCTCTDYFYTDAISASLIKYSINSFLATKVTFFNELNLVFNKSGTTESWTNFISALSLDPRIGSSHMQVPGHDGRFGFGGACLPKDTNAFLSYSEELEAQLTVIRSVIKSNNKTRLKYNNPIRRELDQNIDYSKD